ncbi:MAG TPA: ROK family protein [Aggregatilineales bacterium]|nr:ROK family protein [Aggregatilineales bacterium]
MDEESPIVLGIDIGGTGIKGAPVDTEQGSLRAERFRVLTPQPATPDAVADCVLEIVNHFRWEGRIGLTYPGVVKQGLTMTAANVDESWIGFDAKGLFEMKTHCKTTLINDADAAGMAEMEFGAGKGVQGVVFIATFGTGIGTALFVDGVLFPNTELGHLEIRGKDAERRASDRVRLEKDLSWQDWARRVDEYLNCIEALLWPDLIIIGGGASKNAAKFVPHLTTRAPVVPAQLLNEAGIIGAALTAVPTAKHRLYHQP